MNASPWDYFFESTNGDGVEKHLETILRAERVCADSDWRWLAAVSKLRQNRSISLDEIDDHHLIASICPTNKRYSIEILPTDDFPTTPPEISCDFQAGFDFNWPDMEHSLSSLLESFADYVKRIDFVVNSLQACDGFDFELKEFDLDDEETNAIAATLIVKETGEVLQLLIDPLDPNSFPCRLSSSIPDRFRGLQYDWNVDEPLLFNLENILREADQRAFEKVSILP
ncbi:unnamed protein product, partial [Mesorhabditis belari]|uniref:Uncharacterized protein n=1 Tax=Mesorhabditis belari TaxID=2138241 RepID=A0AAF3J470_9BILA